MPASRTPHCNFFAILTDNEVRKINLTQNIITEIRSLFVDNGEAILADVEAIEFTGNYKIAENEILFVNFELPQNVRQAVRNPIGVHELVLKTDDIRCLFWYDNDTYYFQNFDKRKLLRNKSILIYDRQTYNKLTNEGLIIDNVIHAVYRDDSFFFLSYANANKIFSLADFYKDATDEEIEEFSGSENVAMDMAWFKENTNSAIRKQITLLRKSNILSGANTKHIRKSAKGYNITVELDKDGNICFPNDKKACKELLLFLNEQYWTGSITGMKYKTTSKRSIE